MLLVFSEEARRQLTCQCGRPGACGRMLVTPQFYSVSGLITGNVNAVVNLIHAAVNAM